MCARVIYVHTGAQECRLEGEFQCGIVIGWGKVADHVVDPPQSGCLQCHAGKEGKAPPPVGEEVQRVCTKEIPHENSYAGEGLHNEGGGANTGEDRTLVRMGM